MIPTSIKLTHTSTRRPRRGREVTPGRRSLIRLVGFALLTAGLLGFIPAVAGSQDSGARGKDSHAKGHADQIMSGEVHLVNGEFGSLLGVGSRDNVRLKSSFTAKTRWAIEELETGNVAIRNVHNNELLDADARHKHHNVDTSRNPGTDAEWEIEPIGGPDSFTVRIKNVRYGRWLDGDDQRRWDNVDTSTRGDEPDAQWFIVPADRVGTEDLNLSAVLLVNEFTGRFAVPDDAGNLTQSRKIAPGVIWNADLGAPGEYVLTQPRDGSLLTGLGEAEQWNVVVGPDQVDVRTRWRIVPRDGGAVQLQNVASGRFLDADKQREAYNVDTTTQIDERDGYWRILPVGMIPDTRAPNMVGGVVVNDVAATRFSLSWDAVFDNVGVQSYRVFANGELVAVSESTQVSVVDLDPATIYAVTVVADDANRNASPPSVPVTVSTTDDVMLTVRLIFGQLPCDGSARRAADISGFNSGESVRIVTDGRMVDSVSADGAGVAGIYWQCIAGATDPVITVMGETSGREVTFILPTELTPPPPVGGIEVVLAEDPFQCVGLDAPVQRAGELRGFDPNETVAITWSGGNSSRPADAAGVRTFSWRCSTGGIVDFVASGQASGSVLAFSLPTAGQEGGGVVEPRVFASAVLSTAVTMTWEGAAGGVPPITYAVARDGVVVAPALDVSSYTFENLVPNTSYQFSVQARDAVGGAAPPVGFSLTTPQQGVDGRTDALAAIGLHTQVAASFPEDLTLCMGYLAVKSGGDSTGELPASDRDLIIAGGPGWCAEANARLNAQGVPFVIIDPGHGKYVRTRAQAADPNRLATARYQRDPFGPAGVIEDVVALDMSREVVRIINASGLAIAVLTRDNEFDPFADGCGPPPCLSGTRRRAELFELLEPDTVVSVHTNGSDNPRANGVESFISGANSFRGDEIALAKRLSDAIEALGVELRADPGEPNVPPGVIDDVRTNVQRTPTGGDPLHANVLVEVAFHSNTVDAGDQDRTDNDRLGDPAFRNEAAAAMAAAILNVEIAEPEVPVPPECSGLPGPPLPVDEGRATLAPPPGAFNETVPVYREPFAPLTDQCRRTFATNNDLPRGAFVRVTGQVGQFVSFRQLVTGQTGWLELSSLEPSGVCREVGEGVVIDNRRARPDRIAYWAEIGALEPVDRYFVYATSTDVQDKWLTDSNGFVSGSERFVGETAGQILLEEDDRWWNEYGEQIESDLSRDLVGLKLLTADANVVGFDGTAQSFFDETRAFTCTAGTTPADQGIAVGSLFGVACGGTDAPFAPIDDAEINGIPPQVIDGDDCLLADWLDPSG